jgi:hypothetical protein
MKCIYCNHKHYYILNTGQYKCAKCQRKFSPKKYEDTSKIIDYFLKGVSANKCSMELDKSYITIKKHYQKIRETIIILLENDYANFHSNEYDEYIYLPKSKKRIKENIFDAHNFLTFCYDESKVYNLLMPALQRYKQEFLNSGLEDAYFKEFSKFMMFNKIAKTSKRENTITQFWEFFEEDILKYKGINDKNFIYYLKESEFKFNYSKEEAKNILLQQII